MSSRCRFCSDHVPQPTFGRSLDLISRYSWVSYVPRRQAHGASAMKLAMLVGFYLKAIKRTKYIYMYIKVTIHGSSMAA
jgi:hypothetical protein